MLEYTLLLIKFVSCLFLFIRIKKITFEQERYTSYLSMINHVVSVSATTLYSQNNEKHHKSKHGSHSGESGISHYPEKGFFWIQICIAGGFGSRYLQE